MVDQLLFRGSTEKFERGNTVDRSWIVYSPLKKSVFCFCCLLFPPISNQQSAFALENGFSKWKRTEKLKLHENGPNHRKAFLSWKDLEKRIRLGETIDDESEQQILAEKNKWCEVLKRIVSTIRLLASQNLAFRGHREISQEHQNPGNFLAILKYLSEYDPLMAQHLSTNLDQHRICHLTFKTN